MMTSDENLTQSQKVLAVLRSYAFVGISAEELKDEVMVPQYNWVICEDLRNRKRHVIVSWLGRKHPTDLKAYWRFYYCGRAGEGWLYPPELYPRDVVDLGREMFAAFEGTPRPAAQGKKGGTLKFTMA
jgi:hypothetical protein